MSTSPAARLTSALGARNPRAIAAQRVREAKATVREYTTELARGGHDAESLADLEFGLAATRRRVAKLQAELAALPEVAAERAGREREAARGRELAEQGRLAAAARTAAGVFGEGPSMSTPASRKAQAQGAAFRRMVGADRELPQREGTPASRAAAARAARKAAQA